MDHATNICALLAAQGQLALSSPLRTSVEMYQYLYGEPSPLRYEVDGNGVAISLFRGVMVPDPIIPGGMNGAPDLGSFLQVLRRADADTDVASHTIVIDTPGGSPYGIPAFRKGLAALAKPVRIHVKKACSGGIWAFGGYPGTIEEDGVMGSIGVVGERWDRTAANALEGNAVWVYYDGDGKPDHHPDFPLSESERERLQAKASQMAGRFRRDLARAYGRSIGDIWALEAYTYVGRDAVRAGLIDRVMTTEDAFTESHRANKRLMREADEMATIEISENLRAALNVGADADESAVTAAVMEMKRRAEAAADLQAKADKMSKQLAVLSETSGNISAVTEERDRLKTRVDELDAKVKAADAEAEESAYFDAIKAHAVADMDVQLVEKMIALARDCDGETPAAKVAALAAEELGGNRLYAHLLAPQPVTQQRETERLAARGGSPHNATRPTSGAQFIHRGPAAPVIG